MVSLEFSRRILQKDKTPFSMRCLAALCGSVLAALALSVTGILASYLIIALLILGVYCGLWRCSWSIGLYLMNAYLLHIMTIHTIIAALVSLNTNELMALVVDSGRASATACILVTSVLLIALLVLGLKKLDFSAVGDIVHTRDMRYGMNQFMTISNLYFFLQIAVTRHSVMNRPQLMVQVIMAALLLLIANWALLFYNFRILALLPLEQRNAMLTLAAQTDGMTGLLNKMSAIDGINRRISQGGVLYVVDVDNFKSVNDTHGHSRGDEVLMGVAQCMRAQFRTEDILGRFGGDEFIAFVSPVLSAEAAEHRGAALCEALRAAGDEKNMKVSLSIGILQVHRGQCSSFLDAFQQADRLLYQTKLRGKNSCTVGVYEIKD